MVLGKPTSVRKLSITDSNKARPSAHDLHLAADKHGWMKTVWGHRPKYSEGAQYTGSTDKTQLLQMVWLGSHKVSGNCTIQ